MDTNKIIDSNISEHYELINKLDNKIKKDIAAAGKLIAQSIASGSTIFWCGNGGSASDSLHISSELVGRFKKNRRPLRSITLNSDIAVLTCISNDFEYAEIFSRQIEGLADPNDVLVGISTSGKSTNIINAFQKAKDMNLKTIAFLGKGGGDLISIAQKSILVPSNSTARIQECHIMIGHIICEIIETELGLN